MAAVDEAKWFAIQTRARHEKKVDAQLQEKGIASFLPLSNEMHQWSDRQRLVHQPLFPGYLFVHISDSPDGTQVRSHHFGRLLVCGKPRDGSPHPRQADPRHSDDPE